MDRRSEVAAFRAALTRVADRTPAVIQVSGEVGIGRTRLLEEFATLAEESEAALLITRPTRQTESPFADLLGAAASESLQPLLEALRRPAQDDNFTHVISAAANAAMHKPVWLLIDDLHTSDEATRALTERLLAAVYHGALRGSRVGMVVTLLSGDAAQTLRDRLQALDRNAAGVLLELPAFTGEEVRSWLVARFSAAPDPDLVGLLSDASGGNPLLLGELVSHLQHLGVLREVDGYLTTSVEGGGNTSLPRDLTGLLRNRIESVSGECRRAMTMAAFLGDEFQPQTLGHLLKQSAADLQTAIDEAHRAALVQPRGDGKVAFIHGSARDFLYEVSPRAEREANHRQIGERLIGEFGDGADEHCLTIAHHLIRGGDQADADSIVRFASRAGELALSHHSYFLAGRYFEAAARAGRASLGAAERARLYCNAGEAYQRWSDGPRSDMCFRESERLYDHGSDLSGYARTLQGMLRNGIAFGQMNSTTDGTAAQLERLLSDLPAEATELRVRVHDTLAAYHHAQSRYDVAEAYARSAMTIASGSSNPTLRCIPITSLAMAQMEQLRLSDAKATWLEGLSYDRAAGTPRYEGYHLQRLPVPLFCMGEVQEAARYNQASYRHNRSIGNTGELCLNLSIDTMIANLRGDFQTAIRTGREALDLVATTRYLWSAPSIVAALTYAFTMIERHEEADAVLDHLSVPGLLFDDVSPYRSTATRLQDLVSAYRHPGARGDGARIGSKPRQSARGLRLGSLARLCCEAELALLENRPARLSGIHDLLEYSHRRGVTMALGWCSSIPRALAGSLALRGDYTRAATVFDEARTLAERCGATLERARSDLCQGIAGHASPEARVLDPDKHLRRAIETFERLGASALARLARQVVARSGDGNSNPI